EIHRAAAARAHENGKAPRPAHQHGPREPALASRVVGAGQIIGSWQSCRTRLRLDPDDFWRGEGVVVASLALARGARHASAVQAHPWDLVIIDEAHHIKSRTTLGWKLVDGLKSRFLLLLTATPIENDLEELYQLVTLLKPG
ncbi:MAG: hypothetical protein EXR72_26210, partial [Myxococcales bacterium]|nr:hypothetical protein [Myxococcales bacterium]